MQAITDPEFSIITDAIKVKWPRHYRSLVIRPLRSGAWIQIMWLMQS